MPANPFLIERPQNPFLVQAPPNPFLDLPALGSEVPVQESGLAGFAAGLVSLPSTFLKEVAQDIVGAGKVAISPAGELLELLGVTNPVSFDDVSRRDVRGFGMLLAMGVGAGVAARVGTSLSSIAALQGFKGMALSEAAAGAAFSLVYQGFDEDDGFSVKQFAADVGFGVGFGVGFEAVRRSIASAQRGKLAEVFGRSATQKLASALQRFELEQPVREFAGLRLANKSGAARGLHRDLTTGRVHVTELSTGASREVGEDFGIALGDLVSEGYAIQEGPLRPTFDLANVLQVDEATQRLLEDTHGEVARALGNVRLNEFAEARSALHDLARRDREYASVAAEILASGPYETLGAPRIGREARNGLIDEFRLPKDAPISDAELLTRAIREGVVDGHALLAGADEDLFVRELTLNKVVPNEGLAHIVASPRKSSFMLSLMSPGRIAARFPALAPFVEDAIGRSRVRDSTLAAARSWFVGIRERYSPETIKQGVNAIDAAGDAVRKAKPATNAEGIALANKLALENAGEARGFVQEILDLLGDGRADALHKEGVEFGGYLRRLQESGDLSEAFLGYFPIQNTREWRLDIRGTDKRPFMGFHETREQAEAEFARFLDENPDLRSKAQREITPTRWSWVDDALPAPEHADAIAEGWTGILGGRRSKKRRGGPGNLRDRRLLDEAGGLHFRDFAKDPLDGLWIYMVNMEQHLIMKGLDDVARQTHSAIPRSQEQLKGFVDTLLSDMQGRPRPIERWVDNFVRSESLPIKPRALRRWSALLRRWESTSRLSGFWSPTINMSQFFVNFVPKAGLKAAHASAGFWKGGGTNAKVTEMRRLGIDFGTWAPLSAEGGGLSAAHGVGDAVRAFRATTGIGAQKAKAGLEVLESAGLMAFNGSEKYMRYMGAWGVLETETAKLVGFGVPREAARKAAATRAQQVIDDTFFRYTLGDMPSFLRNPVLATLGQFKSFFVKEVEFLANLTPKQQAGAMAWLTALGGAGTFASMPVLTDLADFFGLATFDRTVGEAVFADGDETVLKRTLAHGLPGLAGVSASRGLGLGTVNELFEGYLGPAGQDIAATLEFAKEVIPASMLGQPVSSEAAGAYINRVMPSALRRVGRGIDIMRTGAVRDGRGSLLYQPTNRAYAAAVAAWGAPTTEMQAEMARSEIQRRIVTRYRNLRSGYGRRAARATLRREPDEVRRVLQEARENGINIDAASLRYYVKQAQLDAGERRRQRTPQDLREELEATGTIAGLPGR